MPVPRPGIEDLDRYGKHYGLTLGADALESFAGLVDGALGSYDVVESLYAETALPTPPEREFTMAADEENDLGAWYVRASISGDVEGGPLDGVRVVVKDNVEVAGIPMMNGSRTLEGFVPRRDATVVTRLLAAGATIIGKATCEDLCFSGSSFTTARGPVRNPWDRTRSAGGSSSGSAVLVATGEADMAVGGDQGGSVRIPAAFCGVVGHKPTWGLVPYTGAFPIERTIDHLGPITSSVRDAARMLTVMAGPDGLDPRQPAHVEAKDYAAELDSGVAGLRVGIVAQGFGHDGVSDAAVDQQVRDAAEGLREIGCEVGTVDLPWHRHAFHVWNVIATDGGAYQMLDGNGYGMNVGGEYDPELMEFFGRQRLERADEASETVKLVALCGRHGATALGGAVYGKARNLVAQARGAYDAALSAYDVLVMPTTPFTASELLRPGDTREVYVGKALGMIANTAPFDVTGHPASSVPTGFVDGLPAAMMIIGRHFDDATVLRAAHAFEQQRGPRPSPTRPASASNPIGAQR